MSSVGRTGKLFKSLEQCSMARVVPSGIIGMTCLILLFVAGHW